MSSTHKTRGIVLKTTKYGETSLVVTILTELFGVQTYLLNGVRSSKKAGAKANYFQPTAILDLVVYHSPNKAMQRIKEFTWAHIYANNLTQVVKNSVASFLVELMFKCLKQPESNVEIYFFCESALIDLDTATERVVANFPLFFSINFPFFLGFKISDTYNQEQNILDLNEGVFTSELPAHSYFARQEVAQLLAQLLKVMHPIELNELALNQTTRRQLLQVIHMYYKLHIPEFGEIKTLKILQEVL
jgi:DNA repair protein RecO (recombination protein O)